MLLVFFNATFDCRIAHIPKCPLTELNPAKRPSQPTCMAEMWRRLSQPTGHDPLAEKSESLLWFLEVPYSAGPQPFQEVEKKVSKASERIVPCICSHFWLSCFRPNVENKEVRQGLLK